MLVSLAAAGSARSNPALHETAFLLEDGQTVDRLVYEPLNDKPSRLYGQDGSHYQRQGLKLSKRFRAWT